MIVGASSTAGPDNHVTGKYFVLSPLTGFLTCPDFPDKLRLSSPSSRDRRYFSFENSSALNVPNINSVVFLRGVCSRIRSFKVMNITAAPMAFQAATSTCESQQPDIPSDGHSQ